MTPANRQRLINLSRRLSDIRDIKRAEDVALALVEAQRDINTILVDVIMRPEVNTDA